MLPQRERERERLVLESHNCEVKQHFGSTWRNTHRGKIFHEQFALCLIFKRNILTVHSPSFVQTEQHCMLFLTFRPMAAQVQRHGVKHDIEPG